jgi:hypothetical protein
MKATIYLCLNQPFIFQKNEQTLSALTKLKSQKNVGKTKMGWIFEDKRE